jgi:Mor family transcriptional regulator
MRLTEEQKQQIISEYVAGTKVKTLAEKYGVVSSSIQQLIKNRNVPRQVQIVTLTESQQSEIIELRKSGMSLEDIVTKTGQKLSTVRHTCAKAGVVLSSEQRKNNSGVAKINQEQKQNLLSDRQHGMTRKELSTKYGLTETGVKSVLRANGLVLPMEQRQANAFKSKNRNLSTRLLNRFGLNSWQEVMELYASKNEGKAISQYVDSSTKMTWECKKQHTFEMIPNSVQQGQWCPSCIGLTSKAQEEINEYVMSLGFQTTLNDKTVINPKHLDVYVPSVKFAIEYDGLYWHSSNFRSKTAHLEKAIMCEKAGIKLLAVYNDEWTNKKDLIKSMIRWRLGKFNGTKIGARDCKLVKLTKNSDFEDFFERNHLDGHAQASYAYGLFYNQKLVVCASIRINFNGETEIARYATDYDYSVGGGFARILKVLPRPLYSFSNNRLSTGEIYSLNNFKLLKTTRPGYWYTDSFMRIDRFKCRRINDPSILEKFPNVPHNEIAQNSMGVTGYKLFGVPKALNRVYDYGHKKWILR